MLFSFPSPPSSHGASCPVGIGVSCSADRQAKAKITRDGVFLEALERNPGRFLPEISDDDLSSEDVVEMNMNSMTMDEIRGIHGVFFSSLVSLIFFSFFFFFFFFFFFSLRLPPLMPPYPNLPNNTQPCFLLTFSSEPRMRPTIAELSRHPVRTRLSLTGTIIVARDIAHAKLLEILEAGGELPDYIKDHIVYYAGPAKTPEGKVRRERERESEERERERERERDYKRGGAKEGRMEVHRKLYDKVRQA